MLTTLSGLRAGGVDPDMLDEYEEGLFQRRPDWVKDFFNQDQESHQGSHNQLDSECNRWLIVTIPEILEDVERLHNKEAVKKAFNSVFDPPDYKEASPRNNFWLRFPDMAPHFLFRDIRSNDFYLLFRGVSSRNCDGSEG